MGCRRNLCRHGAGEVLIECIGAFVETAWFQGGPVIFDCVKGMFHLWQAFVAVLPEAARAVQAGRRTFALRCVSQEEWGGVLPDAIKLITLQVQEVQARG